jgi:hypothetical protein
MLYTSGVARIRASGPPPVPHKRAGVAVEHSTRKVGMMGWQEIRDPLTNQLLARIDSKRCLLELQRKKSTFLVDLLTYLPKKEAALPVATPESAQASE